LTIILIFGYFDIKEKLVSLWHVVVIADEDVFSRVHVTTSSKLPEARGSIEVECDRCAPGEQV
jgi:hypothetical protein